MSTIGMSSHRPINWKGPLLISPAGGDETKGLRTVSVTQSGSDHQTVQAVQHVLNDWNFLNRLNVAQRPNRLRPPAGSTLEPREFFLP